MASGMNGTTMKRTSTLVWTIVLVVASVLGAAILIKLLFGPPSYMGYSPRRRRERVLCKADHETVLGACRELSSRALRGEVKPGTYMVRFSPDPEVSEFPEAIRSLNPAFVDVSETGAVRLEMGSKWGSFGLYACPEGYGKPPQASYGHRKLLEGLWYYDDNYRSASPSDYDAKIEAILRACGRK